MPQLICNKIDKQLACLQELGYTLAVSLSKVSNINPSTYIRLCIIKIHYVIKHRRSSSLNGFRDASSLPFLLQLCR